MSKAKQLWDAAWAGDLPAMNQLLGSEADRESLEVNQALEAAAYNAQVEACHLLLQAGADPNQTAMPTGETVLHQTITKRGDPRRTQIVQALIQAGADVNRRTIPHIPTLCFARDIRTLGETALHRAAAYGDEKMITALLAAGADRTQKDIHGASPLTWASWHLRENDILRPLLYAEFEGTL